MSPWEAELNLMTPELLRTLLPFVRPRAVEATEKLGEENGREREIFNKTPIGRNLETSGE